MNDFRSVIAGLIDAACRCSKCGEPSGAGCACWVRLECPNCGKRRLVAPSETDPPELAKVIFPCPDCDKDDRDPIHVDRNGETISLETMFPDQML